MSVTRQRTAAVVTLLLFAASMIFAPVRAQCGVVDSSGKILIPLQYSGIEAVEKNHFLAHSVKWNSDKPDTKTLLDNHGHEIDLRFLTRKPSRRSKLPEGYSIVCTANEGHIARADAELRTTEGSGSRPTEG